jgi:hypothetical protein
MVRSNGLVMVFALASLAGFHSAAQAGPIVWSYRTQITYAQDYGANFRVLLYSDGMGTVANSPEDGVGFAKLFYSTGNPMSEPGLHVVDYRFQATVTITDVASGQSIDQVWDGVYTSQWSYPPELAGQPELWHWDFQHSSFGSELDRRSFILGNNRYTVWAVGGGDGDFPSGELGVQTVSIQSIPEPASLTLAGIGLGAIVLARKRFWKSR